MVQENSNFKLLFSFENTRKFSDKSYSGPFYEKLHSLNIKHVFGDDEEDDELEGSEDTNVTEKVHIFEVLNPNADLSEEVANPTLHVSYATCKHPILIDYEYMEDGFGGFGPYGGGMGHSAFAGVNSLDEETVLAQVNTVISETDEFFEA